VAGGEIYQAEYRLHRAADDSYHWYLARAIPQRDAKGTIIGWFGSAIDIDAQKQVEAALRESEERFRKVFEEGPIGILMVDRDGCIQRANQYFCDMLGRSEDEIVALGLSGITHPDDWERDYPLVSRMWHGEIAYCHVEKRYLHKNGRAVWCQLTAALMRNEAGRPISIGMIENISERKETEEKLNNSERTMRTLMDANPESILLLDTNETILFANETAAQRMGTTVDKIVGRKSSDTLPPELAAKRMQRLREVVRTGKGVRFGDERSERYYEIAMHPVFDEQGTLFAVAILSIDRTEQRRA
jgi:PAS domain S-box-containing protein